MTEYNTSYSIEPAAIREATPSGHQNICNYSDFNNNSNDEIFSSPSTPRTLRAVQADPQYPSGTTRKRKQSRQLTPRETNQLERDVDEGTQGRIATDAPPDVESRGKRK
jgi:hypothetical protein